MFVLLRVAVACFPVVFFFFRLACLSCELFELNRLFSIVFFFPFPVWVLRSLLSLLFCWDVFPSSRNAEFLPSCELSCSVRVTIIGLFKPCFIVNSCWVYWVDCKCWVHRPVWLFWVRLSHLVYLFKFTSLFCIWILLSFSEFWMVLLAELWCWILS